MLYIKDIFSASGKEYPPFIKQIPIIHVISSLANI